MTPNPSGKFRDDINGLRAWAVGAVILYHFNVPGFPGGFAGVDVFFVISGFLMASIVCGGIDADRFSILGFYLARARRIVPALIALVAGVLIAGYFLLMPSDYKTLGAHARDSLLFYSNFRYLAEAGYFDQESHQKWLLHTWSLAVEWQFYLLYPVLLMALHKFSPRKGIIKKFHWVLLAISAGFCLFQAKEHVEEAFFLLPSRAWELLAGSCVFLAGQRVNWAQRSRQALELLGLALISASVLLVNSTMPWPGELTLAPVLGASLILLAQRQHSFWTGAVFLQWLGSRSYSVYLWHWPVAVCLSYFDLQAQAAWVAGGISLSLLLGHLSFHLVETPCRRWLTTRSNSQAAISICLCLIIVFSAAMLVRRNGLPDRLPPEVKAVDAERQNRNPRLRECLGASAKCTYGGQNIRGLVLGDSHADALITAIEDALPTLNDGLVFRGASSCLFVFNAKRTAAQNDGCHNLREAIRMELPQNHPGKPIILINRTSNYIFGELPANDAAEKPTIYFTQIHERISESYLAEFQANYVASVCTLSQNHPVYLLRPIPEMPVNAPKAMGRELLLGKSLEVRLSRSEYDRRHAFTWQMQDEAAKQCGARILDPLPYLCDQEYCYGSQDGLPIYSDDDHLNERGNKKLVPLFRTVFTEEKQPSRRKEPGYPR